MPSLKEFLSHGSIAAVLSAGLALGAVHLTPRTLHVDQYTVPLKHAWPALTGEQKDVLTEVLKTLPHTIKFDIICNTASCDDLAEDVDDAMEAAGFESGLDHSAGPLGYGVGVLVNDVDKAMAEAAIKALGDASGGALAPSLTIANKGQNPPGYVTVMIGKYKGAK